MHVSVGSERHGGGWDGYTIPRSNHQAHYIYHSQQTKTDINTRSNQEATMIEPFTSTRKILLLALGIINLVVYHGLITHDSYNILSSRNEPFYYICKILTHSRDRHGGVVHAEPERTSCVYCAVPGCGDHASTELGQGPSRGVVSPYAPQSPTLVSNLHHIPAPQHGAAVDWLVHAHVLGTRGTERCGVIADNVPIACYGSNALTLWC